MARSGSPTRSAIEYVDQQLPVVVAKRLRVSPEAVEANEDAARTLGRALARRARTRDARTRRGLGRPSRSTKSCCARCRTRCASTPRAATCVIVGRGASAILGGRARRAARLHARAARMAHRARRRDDGQCAARPREAEVDRVDRARAAYMRDWYGLTFGDPQQLRSLHRRVASRRGAVRRAHRCRGTCATARRRDRI